MTRLFLCISTLGLSEAEFTRLEGKAEDHVELYKKSEGEYLKMPSEPGEKEQFNAQNEKWDGALQITREGEELVGKTDEPATTRMRELRCEGRRQSESRSIQSPDR